jgi:hypothetical protein
LVLFVAIYVEMDLKTDRADFWKRNLTNILVSSGTQGNHPFAVDRYHAISPADGEKEI